MKFAAVLFVFFSPIATFLYPSTGKSKGVPLILRTTVTAALDSPLSVPIAGNSWAKNSTGRKQLITENGIENWTSADVQINTYVRVNKQGTIQIKIKAKTDGQSTITLNLNKEKRAVNIKSAQFSLYNVGEWEVTDPGYIKITLAAVSKTGKVFAEVNEYEISGSAIDAKTAFVESNEGNFFYWGRRGPSVHLTYPLPDSTKASWFYNEITIPKEQDVVGSYFMAIGFGEGYFGIQVNSPTERRILFSVWSPFKTDNPDSIPEGKRIIMLKKGDGVYAGAFGNEGSGGQSFLRYNWKAGISYKFLINGQPDSKGNTIYTAYFFFPEKNNWFLVASFKRPETSTYLTKFHSFLENFLPGQGDQDRKVLFDNQWIYDTNGNWTEVTKAIFTYDNTAAKRYRMDYAGGIEKGSFYLKNCGFFNHYTPYKSIFDRQAKNIRPVVNLKALP